MTDPTDLLHPSPFSHFRILKIFLICFAKSVIFSTLTSYAPKVALHWFIPRIWVQILWRKTLCLRQLPDTELGNSLHFIVPETPIPLHNNLILVSVLSYFNPVHILRTSLHLSPISVPQLHNVSHFFTIYVKDFCNFAIIPMPSSWILHLIDWIFLKIFGKNYAPLSSS